MSTATAAGSRRPGRSFPGRWPHGYATAPGGSASAPRPCSTRRGRSSWRARAGTTTLPSAPCSWAGRRGDPGTGPLSPAVLNSRHSPQDSAAGPGGGTGVVAVTRQERTNYPFTVCVDDTGDTFVLTALTDRRIDPRRAADYLCTAVESLV